MGVEVPSFYRSWCVMDSMKLLLRALFSFATSVLSFGRAQCITDIPSFLVASTNDKLSDKNLQLALQVFGDSGKPDARKRFMHCSVYVHPDKNALGDSCEQATLRFQLLLKVWKIVKEKFKLS